MIETTNRDVAALRAGSVLRRALHHPATGQILLAAGSVLNDAYISKILRLGMATEALAALSDAGPRPAAQTPTDEASKTPIPFLRRAAKDASASADSIPPPSPTPVRQLTVERAKRNTQELEGKLSKALDALKERGDEPASPDALKETIESILSPAEDGEIAVGSAMSLVEAIVQRIQSLGASGIPDLRVYGGEATHPINVFLLSVAIGIALDQSWDELVSLGQAALLHDVGKYRISRKLYNKDTPLTPTEERVMERHVEYGLDVLKNYQASFPKLNNGVYQGIRCHHERWDGQGYPQGIKGRNIPLVARIIAVADVYVARTEDHVRSRRVSPSEAYREILAQAGKAFDPLVVSAFKKVIVPYPLQSLVQLETGQVAQVIRQGASPDLPVVQLGLGEGALDLGFPGSPRIVRQVFPRKYPRVAIELPAVIHERGDSELAPGRIVDLSLGGAGMILSKPFPAGTRVTLSVATADMEVVTLDGVVVWRAPQASGQSPLGIRFGPLSPDTRKDLEKLMGQPRSWSWKRA
jgi:HD-GYP domain-containing protein (c-di-GMP phosphodiesterase class II)